MLDKMSEIHQLPDGRKLGYAVYGDPDGYPILFFHGIPGSRLQRVPDLSFLGEMSIILYSIDRPGIGLSSPHENRTVIDWAHDIEHFCSVLKISRYSVVGVSGGAPYALACASMLHQHMDHVALISGLAPIDNSMNLREMDPRIRIVFKIARRHPLLLNGYLSFVYKFFKNKPTDAFNYFMSNLPEYDKRLFSTTKIANMFESDIAEAFKNGGEGVVNEIQTLLKPWGFELDKIKMSVDMWHGTSDTIVPFGLFKYLVNELPHVIPHVIKNGGHFIALEHAPQIFGQIKK